MSDAPRAVLVIAIVDDDRAVLESIADLLGSLGCTPWPFAEGAAAVEFLERNPVDAVLVDRSMPAMSGEDVVRVLRASSLNATVPIIIFTGSLEDEAMSEAFSAGATAYISKPLDRERLSRLLTLVRTLRSSRGG
jgi:CheY-like chemotaxis protein